MSPNLLIEYFQETKSFKQCQENFQHLLGIQFELRRMDGTRLYFNKDLPSQTTTSQFASTKATCPCKLYQEDCLRIPNELLTHAVATARAQIVTCKAGYKKVFIPIVLRKKVSGFLVTGEHENCRLSNLQMKSIVKLLENEIQSVDKNELTHFTDVVPNNITHQQQTAKKVIEYLEENYHRQDLSLEKTAKENGISYFHLSRLFKKELSKSFSEYLSEFRMKVGCRLLKDKRLTISQVSFFCGFEDPGYFCKVFKKYHKKSPLAYRKKLL